MSDKAILKLFQDSKTYFRFNEYVKGYTLLDESRFLLEQYGKYYNQVSKDWDLEEFLTFVGNINQVSEDKFNKLKETLLAVESYSNTALAEEIVINYLKQELSESLAEIANDSIDGGDIDTEQVIQLVKDFEVECNLDDLDKFEFAPATIEELYELSQTKTGLSWSLPTINTDYGPAKEGDLIHVFANSNVGKTSFVVNECLNFMKQLPDDKPILWINNEEMITRVNERFYQCATGGRVLIDSYESRKEAQMQADSLYSLSTRLKAFQAPTGVYTQKDYEQLIEQIRPAVVVFNNLDKVKKQPDDTNSAQHLTQIYYWARTIASMYECVVIGVGQASNDAVNRLKLDKSHLADCKVGKAGECDLIVGIGYNDQDREHRQINLVKNKFGPESAFSCEFDGLTGRYVEETFETYGY